MPTLGVFFPASARVPGNWMLSCALGGAWQLETHSVLPLVESVLSHLPRVLAGSRVSTQKALGPPDVICFMCKG